MRWMLLIALAGLAGCGGDGTSSDRVPEDYLAEPLPDGLTEAQRLCVLHEIVSYGRFRECDPLGPMDWTAPTAEVLQPLVEDRCAAAQPEDYTGAAEHVPRCLDYRASAPCEALALEAPPPGYEACELVSPSW